MTSQHLNINNIIILIAIIVLAGYFIFTNMNNNTKTNEGHYKDEVVESYEIYPGIVADKIKNNEDFVLLDVRTLEEYEEIHLKGAVLLPVQELSEKTLAEIGLGKDSKDREIIIYCRSGGRSQTAYNIMNSLGYTNIKSVSGGIIHYEEDNYPFTESGEYVERVITKETKSDTSTYGPRISLSKDSHDFGVISQYGGTVEETFEVENIGTETLKIGDIMTSCSCTTATISKTEIEVDSKAILTVVFDPNFHEEPVGRFKRTVFIQTNDRNNTEAEVVISVDIREGE